MVDWYSWLKVINNEIVPGPANIGMAKGVNEIASREWISFWTLSRFIPLCSLNFPVNSANPEEAIIKPPAIFKAFKLIPKKDKIYLPAKKESNKIIKTSIAVQNAVTARSRLLLSCVKLTNTGTVPSGFMMENNAPKLIKNKSIVFFYKFTAFNQLERYGTFNLWYENC